MFLQARRRMAILCAGLLLWQAGLAPLAHAAAMHAQPQDVVLLENPVAQATTAGAEGMPCHGHDAGGSAPTSVHEPDVSPHGASLATDMKSGNSELPDCCQSLDCQCACAHASLASMTLPISSSVVPDHPTVLGSHLPLLRARVVELFKPPI